MIESAIGVSEVSGRVVVAFPAGWAAIVVAFRAQFAAPANKRTVNSIADRFM